MLSRTRRGAEEGVVQRTERGHLDTEWQGRVQAQAAARLRGCYLCLDLVRQPERLPFVPLPSSCRSSEVKKI